MGKNVRTCGNERRKSVNDLESESVFRLVALLYVYITEILMCKYRTIECITLNE